MSLSITIDGTDVVPQSAGLTYLHGSLNVSIDLGGRASAQFRLRSRVNYYSIEPEQEVIITANGTRIFGGYLETIDEKHEAGYTENAGLEPLYWIPVTCADYSKILEHRSINTEITVEVGTSLQDLVEFINDNFLDGEGFTVGTVSSTVTLAESFVLEVQTVKAALDKLSDVFQSDYSIDFYQEITMVPAGSAPAAPYTLSNNDGNFLVNTLKVRRTLKGYANTQVVPTGGAVSTQNDETYVGDSVSRYFETVEAIVQRPSVYVDDVAQVVADSLDTAEMAAAHDFYWTPGTRGVTQNSSETILNAGNDLRIVYERVSPSVAIARSTAQITARAAASRFSGKWEQVTPSPTMSGPLNSQDFADGLVARTSDGGPGKFVDFDSDKMGWLPGQKITSTVTLPPSATGTFLITAVRINEVLVAHRDGASRTYVRSSISGNTGEAKKRDFPTVLRNSVSNVTSSQTNSIGGSSTSSEERPCWHLAETIQGEANPGLIAGVRVGGNIPITGPYGSKQFTEAVVTAKTPSSSGDVELNIKSDAAGEAITVTLDNTTDTVEATGHGQIDGEDGVLSTTGSLPTGLTAGTTYYIVNATTNDFQLSATRGGAPITFTTNGTGTITWTNSRTSILSGLLTLPEDSTGPVFLPVSGIGTRGDTLSLDVVSPGTDAADLIVVLRLRS